MEVNFVDVMNSGSDLTEISVENKKLSVWSAQGWTNMGEDSNQTGSSKRKHVDSPQTWQDNSNGGSKCLRLENVSVNSESGQIIRNSKTDSHLNTWQHVEDLANNLAADFEGNFSGLEVDLNSSSYTLNDALLSLPSLTVFKQESLSPDHAQTHNENSNSRSAEDAGTYQQVSPYRSDGTECSNSTHLEELVTLCPRSNSNEVTSTGSPSHNSSGIEEVRFQYVLAAATSIATKINEESLTYLNQGQSYEIKFKTCGHQNTLVQGKKLKTVIRVSFHDRRLQYTEREQMTLWRASRPGDRILEVDLPLSYGVYDLVQDASSFNSIQFLWDPSKEVGVYIKVNCISTEFTPKKHGGEKGVPFRIQVDTFDQDAPARHLHSASCQIKVFKLKGADRKHKQDKEKIMKRCLGKQEKYQQSFEYTVLTEVQYNAENPPPVTPALSVSSHGADSSDSGNEPNNFQLVGANVSKDDIEKPHDGEMPDFQDGLISFKREFSANQVQGWLQARDFSPFLVSFSNYTGMDMLRLSRDDLKTLCGLSEGIRLYNSLHPELLAHKRTIYILIDPESMVYHPIFLYRLTSSELCTKLIALLGLTQSQIADFYLQGPNDIHVIITNELVNHIKDESMFTVDILQDMNGSDRYRLLLKSLASNPEPPG